MKVRLVEATNYPQGINWGKFMLATFDRDEWDLASTIAEGEGLLQGRGFTPLHVLVVDLQTKEGAFFVPGGNAIEDLKSHRVWVCPLFQPFLEWLYRQPDPMAIETPVHLPLADSAIYGYRRQGA